MNRPRPSGRLRFLLGLLAACLLAGTTAGHAQGLWSEYAMVSATLGVHDSRICVGEANRGDLGCPLHAPQVLASGLLSATDISATGTIQAGQFVGDGSGLTGVTAAATDRIVSGTTTMIVVSSTGFISLTQGATNTGWFDPLRGLVTLGVSTTGPISGTEGYFSGSVYANLPFGGHFGAFQNNAEIVNIGYNNLSSGQATSSRMVVVGKNIGQYLWDGTDSVFIGNNIATGGRSGPFAYPNISRTVAIGSYLLNGDLNGWRASEAVLIGYNSGNSFPENRSVVIGAFAGDATAHNGTDSVLIGFSADKARSNQYNVVIGSGAEARSPLNDLTTNGSTNGFLSVIGADAVGNTSNTVVLGRTSDATVIGSQGRLSGVSAALQVTGNAYFSNNIGIGTTSPKTRIDVSGTLRLASGGEACDSDRTGAIRYTNGDFEFCRDGTTWQDLASIADSAAPDRIVSGTTTMVVVSSTGFISLTQGGTNTGWFDPQRGLVTLGVSSTGPISATAGHFSGTVSATLLKLAADPVASCTNDSLGTVKIANGRVFVCRP